MRLLALLTLLTLAAPAMAQKTHFGLPHKHCEKCYPGHEMAPVEHECFNVDCEKICIPAVRFPWECGKGFCKPGHVRVVKRLSKEKYECGEKCVWKWPTWPCWSKGRRPEDDEDAPQPPVDEIEPPGLPLPDVEPVPPVDPIPPSVPEIGPSGVPNDAPLPPPIDARNRANSRPAFAQRQPQAAPVSHRRGFQNYQR